MYLFNQLAILFGLYFEIFYLYLTCGAVIIGTFFFLNGHQIVTHTIVTNYTRWKNINNLLSGQYTNIFYVFWYSLALINKALYLSFIQYMNNSVKKINKNTYEISYLVNGKMYNMIITPIKGPARILQVIDENNEDVTDMVLPYAGPINDWHGRSFTPKDFKRSTLTFELGCGREITFKEDQTLNVEC